MIDSETQGVLTQLRAYLGHRGSAGGGASAARAAAGRGARRQPRDAAQALADLEAEGLIWRHVGRGTFVGNRPVETVQDLTEVMRRTNPAGVMEARLALEPELARLAAMHATPADLDELAERDPEAGVADWRSYEYWDNRLHRAVATGRPRTSSCWRCSTACNADPAHGRPGAGCGASRPARTPRITASPSMTASWPPWPSAIRHGGRRGDAPHSALGPRPPAAPAGRHGRS